MAESVDALVSNTSGAIHPGSIPGLGTELEILLSRVSNFYFIFFYFVSRWSAMLTAAIISG